MFGINIDEDSTSSTEKVTERSQTIHTGSSVVQIKDAALKAVHRIFQLIFMLGPLFFPIATKKRDNQKVDLFSVLTICMVTVAGGEPRWYCWSIECDEIAVRTRNKYPRMRRKVNVNYLRTARTTATGDPLRGAHPSGLCAFQPRSCAREGS